MAISRGKRTSLVSGNISVNRTQGGGLGTAIQSFGETALKIAEQQAVVMDEIWKGDFKVKTAKFLNDLSIEQEAMDMPDLTSAQQEILGYKEELINSSSKRYSKYIENYLDLKGIDTLDTLRKRSNAIMFNNVSGAINSELDLLVNQSYNSVNKIAENPDILTGIDFRNEVEKIFENASLDINDINFGAAQSLNPLEYNDQYIGSLVDNNLTKLETNRMYGIAMSMYKGVDFTNPDEVAAADARVLEFKENYLSGKEKRLSNNFDIDTINKNIIAFENNVETIKALNNADISQGQSVAEFAQIVNQNKMKDAIESNSIVSSAFYSETTIDSLYTQLEPLGLQDNEDLINTFMGKKQVYSYLEDLAKKESITPNNVDLYFGHIKNNLGVDTFENKDDLKDFVNSFVNNQINLANVYATGKTYTVQDWFADLGKPVGEQLPATVLKNKQILDGVIDEDLQGAFQNVYNILAKGKLDIDDINNVTNLYQGWEFTTNRNPLAKANMDGVDQGFFQYVEDQGGLSALDTQGPANLYTAYLEQVNLQKSKKGEIVLNENEILNDPVVQKGINLQLTAEMIDAVMTDDTLRTMAAPFWNLIMKDPEFQFATTNPLKDFVQLKEGFVTGKGGQMSDMNYLQQVFIKGQQTINTVFDLVNPFDTDFMNERFTKTFFEVKPEVQEYINRAVINQIPNFMDSTLFAENMELAQEEFARVAPDIVKTVIRNLNDDQYSLSGLGSRNGNLELVKFGYEAEMAKAGYSEEDMMTRTAYDIAGILKGYEEEYDENFMFDKFGFLYRDEGRYVQPSLQDIKDSLEKGDFSIVPVRGGNQPIYQLFVNNFDSGMRSIPLGVKGDEKIVIEQFDPDAIDPYSTPISKKQIMDSITMDLVNNPESLFNKIPGFENMPEGMKKFTVQFLTQPQFRQGTELFLEPFIEFITGGRYDYKSVEDEMNKYIDQEYRKRYEEYLD